MLNEAQKEILKKKINSILEESYPMSLGFVPDNNVDIFEKKKKHKDTEGGKHHKEEHIDSEKRKQVMRWLASAQEKHSQIAYRLFPDIDKDTARSEFSKKYHGEDADGNTYNFDTHELNTLYNIMNDFLEKLTENKIKKIVSESIKKYLK